MIRLVAAALAVVAATVSTRGTAGTDTSTQSTGDSTNVPLLLDGFEALDGWKTTLSDGVSLTLGQDAGAHGKAIRLEDATSTTIAVNPADELANLPQPALNRTFGKYYENFLARRDGRLAWDAYTPYELRVVGTFVRMGQKAHAHELLDFFFRDQRPKEWHQWAEVVWHDPRTPKFIGDMPHTWVGSDYIRSVLDMFAYERESDSSLVIGAGILQGWVNQKPGVEVRDLSTHYGRLSYTMRASPGSVRIQIAGVRVPRGGLVIRSPADKPIRGATVNGRDTGFNDSEIIVRSLPASITLRY